MCVEHYNYRNNGAGESLLSSYQQTPLDAVESLCVYELGYGGHVTELTDTRVEIRTEAGSARDRTVFEGSVSDMAPVVKAAATASLVAHTCRQQIIEGAAGALAEMPEEIRGLAFHVANITPFLLGFGPAKVALLAVAGALDAKSVEGVAEMRLPALMMVLRLQAAGDEFLSGAAKVRAALAGGLKGEQLHDCVDIAKRNQLELADVLPAAALLASKGLPVTDAPVLLALAKETGLPLTEVVESLTV